MKTRFLGVAVVLVALAFIVNALALSSASINNTGFTANIVNSNAALIAITTGAAQDNDITVTANQTKASISVAAGIQADATYTFGDAFGIKNNSNEANIYVDVAVADGSGATLTLAPTGGCTSAGGGALKNLTIAKGATCSLGLTLSTGAAATASTTPFTINITADKVSNN